MEAFGTHFVQLQATRNSCSQGSERQQQEIALQRQESSQFIQNNFEEHIFPVAGLGKAALSLRMKIYALLHQIKLEVESMEEFREFLSATVSITTDQGTEAGFAELPSLDLSPFQPPTDDISIECCDDEAGPLPIHVEFDDGEDLVHEGPARPGVQPAAEAAAPSRAGSNLPPDGSLWPFTLSVAGMCHICHNACEELCTQLPCWDSLVEQLRPVASFLHNRPARQRYVEKCLRENVEMNKSFRAQLEEGNFHSLYTARWGSTSRVLEEILSVRVLLTTTWDTRKYSDGSESETLKGQLSSISAAIAEPLFCARCHMLLFLDSATEHFSNWCEGCPCHPLPHLKGRWRRQRDYMLGSGLLDLEAEAHLLSCPMKGARAPEMASGDHDYLLADLLEQSCRAMLESLPVLLTVEDGVFSFVWFRGVFWYCLGSKKHVDKTGSFS